MNVTRGRRTAFAAVIMLACTSVPTMAQAAPRVGVKNSALTVAPAASVARTGSTVAVRGTVRTDGSRTVHLQRLSGKTWRTVDSDVTSGSVSLTAPAVTSGVWYYRVVAPADGPLPVAVSRTFTIGYGIGDAADHAFLADPPVRWDACTPIGYRVNAADAPEGGLADVRKAVELAAAASGLTMTYRGTTTVVPGAAGTSTPDAYPADTQIVIAWTEPSGTALLKNRSNVLGVGGLFYDRTPQKIGRHVWQQAMQGYVVLNTAKDIPGGFGSGRSVGELGTWGQVIMHEVGHTLGLAHTSGTADEQIMYPETTRKPAAWGLGDLTALRALGRSAGCFQPDPGDDDDSSDIDAGATSAMVAGVARARSRHH